MTFEKQAVEAYKRKLIDLGLGELEIDIVTSAFSTGYNLRSIKYEGNSINLSNLLASESEK